MVRRSSPSAEADAVVGRDDHERVAVEAGAPQAAHELAEQPVRHAELQQVPLIGHLDEPRHAEPERAVQAGDRLGREAAIAPARRVVLPRHVRQEHVLEPEGRLPGRPHAAHELAEAARLPAREVARGRAGRRHAQARRAQSGRLLGHVQLVVVRQQREQVRRVRVDVGPEARPRIAPVEHRRHGQRRAVVHRGRAAEPEAVVGELRERRVARIIEPPAGFHQGRERQLVEHHDHDRLRRRDRVRHGPPAGASQRGSRAGRAAQRQPEAEQHGGQRRYSEDNPNDLSAQHESPAYPGFSPGRHLRNAAFGGRIAEWVRRSGPRSARQFFLLSPQPRPPASSATPVRTASTPAATAPTPSRRAR